MIKKNFRYEFVHFICSLANDAYCEVLISALIVSFVGLAVKGDRDIVNTLEKIFIVAIQLQNGKVVVP